MRKIVDLSIRTLLGVGFLFLLTACQHSPVSEAPKHPDIIDFHVSVTPDIETGVIYGVQRIIVRLSKGIPQTMLFSPGTLTITEISVDGHRTEMALIDGKLALNLVPAKGGNELLEITAKYASHPERGYAIGTSGVYTEYFACDWMLCQQENFSDKATVTLELNLPKKMQSIGPGKLLESKWLPNGLYQSSWRSDAAYAPYLYAFAFGDFVTATQKAGNVLLHYMSSVANEAALLKLFAPTAEMLNFFEGKAGTPFPHDEYTQLYVEGGSAQEAISHSVIGESWLKPMLSDPQEDWVIAHELAHQWWGNGVTCADISEFWLNEGITVFMVSAWKEYRWGRAAYERDLQFSKQGYQRAIDAGMDVPLAYDGEYPSLRIRRAIQYSKGAVFMDLLRSELGEAAFWGGLRDYTAENMGKTVSSINLQLALERTSKRDLSAIFNKWVYGSPNR